MDTSTVSPTLPGSSEARRHRARSPGASLGDGSYVPNFLVPFGSRRAPSAALRQRNRRRIADRLARVAFSTLPRWLVHFDILYVTVLCAPLRVRRRPRVAVRRVTEDDLTTLRRLFPRPDPSTYAGRLAAGHVGLVAQIDRQVRGMMWVNLGREHDEEEKFCRFRIPAGAAWGYDVMVQPRWQLSGAFLSLVDAAYEVVRKSGRHCMLGYASWHNRKSLQAHYRFGHTPLQRVIVFNILGARLHRCVHLGDASPPFTRVGFGSHPTIPVELASQSELERKQEVT